MEAFAGHGGYIKRGLPILLEGDDWAEFQKISIYSFIKQKRGSGQNYKQFAVFGAQCVIDKDVEMSMDHVMKGF